MTKDERAWCEHPLYSEMQASKPYSVRRRRFWFIFGLVAALTVVCCALAGAGWIW